MNFRSRNIREIAKMVIGDNEHFQYLSSSYITQFFEECDLNFVHDGTTRWSWTADRLTELLSEPQPSAFTLPDRFLSVLRTLMLKADALDNDPDRSIALKELNKPLSRGGMKHFTMRIITSKFDISEPKPFLRHQTRIAPLRQMKLRTAKVFLNS